MRVLQNVLIFKSKSFDLVRLGRSYVRVINSSNSMHLADIGLLASGYFSVELRQSLSSYKTKSIMAVTESLMMELLLSMGKIPCNLQIDDDLNDFNKILESSLSNLESHREILTELPNVRTRYIISKMRVNVRADKSIEFKQSLVRCAGTSSSSEYSKLPSIKYLTRRGSTCHIVKLRMSNGSNLNVRATYNPDVVNNDLSRCLVEIFNRLYNVSKSEELEEAII